jgi:isopentenyl diphosphate isomerase/L-lactate dehydrogenase-like FMN-dependent dehydrogenase
MKPVNLHEFEAIAREKLSEGAYGYYAGGAGDEITLRENEAAFARRRLRPRVLVDVAEIDTSVVVLGRTWRLPFGIAPMAQHKLAHPDGEAATARAASERGVLYCASTSSSLSCEEIASACESPKWFQLYTQDDCGPRTEKLLGRALDCGYEAIVLTVDLAVSGLRERERAYRFELDDLAFGNFAPETDEESKALRVAPPSHFSWRDVAWLRERVPVPLVMKGILTAEDARLAVEHGADAVWVSNHGGRQLDRSPATIDVLEEIAGAVGDGVEVYVDGGVRRGVDVVTALALGARAVFVGRPMLYALAYDGEAGVRRAISLLEAEVRNTMALLGTASVGAITRSHVV